MSRTVRPARRKRILLAAGVALALCIEASHAAGQPARTSLEQLPVVLNADEITYDQELDIVTARGNVEIVQDRRVLRADTVSYNRRADLITASGNITLTEPTGDVLFADYIEISDDFREGIIQNFRAVLADQSRMAAVSARRSEGNITAARSVVYSPCELCPADPTRAPLWQIKANRVTHNQEGRYIAYRDAWLEVFGVPVAYTPYLSHPDGTVQRQSGLLAPEFGSSSILGAMIVTPYYQTIGPSADFTFEPIFLSKENPVAAGEFRQRTTAGAYLLSGSITSADSRDAAGNPTGGTEVLGHARGVGRFDINDNWRWGFDVERATNDFYLKRYHLFDRYGFLDRNTLTTQPFVEGFFGRDYALATGYAFQDLRPDADSGLTPLVLPLMQYSAIGEPGAYGGRFSFDTSALSIYRSEGTRTQRLAMQGGWLAPYVTESGHIFTLSGRLLGELYNVTNIDNPEDPTRPTEEGASGRVFPQMSLGWRYPLVNPGRAYRTVIEPTVSFVAAPNLGDQSSFPNEDSRNVNLDVTSLFRPNRFSGIDRLEGGQRVNYGLGANVTRLAGGSASAFLGQSYRLQEQEAFPEGSGLEDRLSNIVGRVSATPHPFASASYQFQLNKDDFSAQQSLLGVQLGPPALQLSVGYTFVDHTAQSTFPTDIEQVSTVLSANLTPNWRIQVREVHSLSEDEGLLLGGASLIYEDECILAGVDFARRRIGTPDNPPEDTILFRVVFRNLGEVAARAM